MKRTSPDRRNALLPGGGGRTARLWALRFYRLAVVAVVTGLLRYQVSQGKVAVTHPLPLESVQHWFPDVARLGPVMPQRQAWPVLSEEGKEPGGILRTSPVSDGIVGYAGPHDLLIAEEMDGLVRGISILKSGDTPDHVEAVARDPNLAAAFRKWQPAVQSVPDVQAVSGSTLTSLAMTEAVALRLGGALLPLRFPEAVTMG